MLSLLKLASLATKYLQTLTKGKKKKRGGGVIGNGKISLPKNKNKKKKKILASPLPSSLFPKVEIFVLSVLIIKVILFYIKFIFF